MTAFSVIQDRQRLTLEMRERSAGNYSWFLFAAGYGDHGFGPDHLVARSADLSDETNARKGGLAALLAYKREVSFARAGPMGLPSQQSIAPVSVLAPDQELINQLVDNISARLDELGSTLRLIRSRLSEAPIPEPLDLPVVSGIATEYSRSAAHVHNAWRLLVDRFVLLSPQNIQVTLTAAEQEFLLSLFQAREYVVTGRRLSTDADTTTPPRTASSLSVLVSRLRKKCHRHGIDLPVHKVRAGGYRFVGDTAVLAA